MERQARITEGDPAILELAGIGVPCDKTDSSDRSDSATYADPMRMVPSPTARVLAIALATFLAATMMTAGPAAASTPQTPGNFTGYGFDACGAPTQKVMDAWNLKSPYSAIGIYISGNSRYCGNKYQPNLSRAWVQANANNGWRFMPIHVGYQAPCFKNNPNSRVQKKRMSTTVGTARKQARSDATESLAAATTYGFGKGSVLYLDIEWYSRSNAACDNVTLEFIDAWTEKLRSAGYKSGLYSSGSAAIASVNDARLNHRAGFTFPDHMWIAWTNRVANSDGGPYLSDSVWTNHQRIHQYHNGVNVRYGGYTLNIDKNFLDVGKGSVRVAEPKPCGVAMSFTSYANLKVGSKGAQVAALQCILRQLGYKKSITSVFGTGTRDGVNKFRKLHGWAQNGAVNGVVWTSLLAVGGKPRVMKYGSGDQAVWRLQRALVAAGKKVTINGLYGSATVNAVQAYRTKNKLPSYPTTEASVWSLLSRGMPG